MKKIILVLVLVLSLGACTSSAPKENPDQDFDTFYRGTPEDLEKLPTPPKDNAEACSVDEPSCDETKVK